MVPCLISIIIITVSLIITLCDALIPWGLWTHPILNFICIVFFGFGLLCFVYGIKKESPWYFFVSTCLLGLAIFYVLIHYIIWWLNLIIIGSIVAIVSIFSFILFGSKTEDIVINNDDNKNIK